MALEEESPVLPQPWAVLLQEVHPCQPGPFVVCCKVTQKAWPVPVMPGHAGGPSGKQGEGELLSLGCKLLLREPARVPCCCLFGDIPPVGGETFSIGELIWSRRL